MLCLFWSFNRQIFWSQRSSFFLMFGTTKKNLLNFKWIRAVESKHQSCKYIFLGLTAMLLRWRLDCQVCHSKYKKIQKKMLLTKFSKLKSQCCRLWLDENHYFFSKDLASNSHHSSKTKGNIILNCALLYKYDVSYSSLIESLTVFVAGFIFIIFAADGFSFSWIWFDFWVQFNKTNKKKTGILKENEYQLLVMFLVAWLLTGMTLIFMLTRFWNVFLDVLILQQDIVNSYGFPFCFFVFSFPNKIFWQNFSIGTLFVVVIPSYIVVLCQMVFLVLFLPVYQSFGWKIFDRVGTNKETISFNIIFFVFVQNLFSIFMSFLFQKDVTNITWFT